MSRDSGGSGFNWLMHNDSMFKLILHSRKLEFLRTAFTVNLSAVALLMVQIFELNLEVILYITFFVLQVQETALN